VHVAFTDSWGNTRGTSEVPVFIDLSVFGTLEPQEALFLRLKKYGELTDRKLVNVFLDHGGFLFLLDGVNEIGDEPLKRLLAYVDTYREHNFACLTTQIPTRELMRRAASQELRPLAQTEVVILLRRFADAPDRPEAMFRAEELLERFTAATYALCSVPVQLELVVEIWRRRRQLPQDLETLFAYALQDVLDRDRWAQDGHPDYADVLAQVAYGMLSEKRPYDPASHALPQMLLDDLLAAKLLTTRGAVMEFRHDKIRSYLAFLHFRVRWSVLLADESAFVDSNWDSMIQFQLAQEQSPAMAEKLLLLVLQRDVDTARRLYVWLQHNRSALCGEWQARFKAAVGDKILGRADVPAAGG